MHIYGIQKDCTDEIICKTAMETQTQRTDIWTGWAGGRKEMVGCMERVTWKHALPYVKQVTNGNLLYDSGNSNQGSVMTQRGDRVGGGKEGTCIYLWLIHVDVRQKPTQYCKAIILQVKINFYKRKKKMLLFLFFCT